MYPIAQAYPKYLHTKIAVRVVINKYSNVDNSVICISFLMGEGRGGESPGIPQTLQLDLPLHDVAHIGISGDNSHIFVMMNS